MNTPSVFSKTLLALLCLTALPAFARGEKKKGVKEISSYEEQKQQIIKNLKKIISSFDVKKLGIEAVKSTVLTTDELGLRDIQSLNFTIQAYQYMQSIPMLAQGLSHELFHARNHVNNFNELLDDVENNVIEARRGYVKLYNYSAPVMMNVMQDVARKAIKILQWGEDQDLA